MICNVSPNIVAAVVKSPVAMHVNMAGRGGGQGYPGALLGTIAFTKQGFLDAQWQRDAEAHYTRTGAKGPRPLIEPALDALRPALARQMPVALDANQAREIDRALAIAAQFATPEALNFMMTHGRGQICLCLTEARADELALRLISGADGVGCVAWLQPPLVVPSFSFLRRLS